ncbi:hypothetical protein BC829DRAFT_279953 [Chytridium lagenaria]|nr:hypothetical protein BC829DRAFT_279953 [Chytridium lagenaria]
MLSASLLLLLLPVLQVHATVGERQLCSPTLPCGPDLHCVPLDHITPASPGICRPLLPSIPVAPSAATAKASARAGLICSPDDVGHGPKQRFVVYGECMRVEGISGLNWGKLWRREIVRGQRIRAPVVTVKPVETVVVEPPVRFVPPPNTVTILPVRPVETEEVEPPVRFVPPANKVTILPVETMMMDRPVRFGRLRCDRVLR